MNNVWTTHGSRMDDKQVFSSTSSRSYVRATKKANGDSDVIAGAECDKDYLFLQDLTV